MVVVLVADLKRADMTTRMDMRTVEPKKAGVADDEEQSTMHDQRPSISRGCE